MNNYASKDNDGFLLHFDDETPETERKFYITTYPNVDMVLEKRLHCTACGVHIGSAPINETIVRMHPILRITHCAKCHTFYNSGEFSKGEDGSELYCRWCGQGGEVYCCSKCPFVFCKKCIVSNLTRTCINDIAKNENWRCFQCDPLIMWNLRAQHWAFINFIRKQKEKIAKTSCTEEEVNELMNKDISICCIAKSKRKPIEIVNRKRSLSSTSTTSTYDPVAKKPLVVSPRSILPKENQLKLETVIPKITLLNTPTLIPVQKPKKSNSQDVVVCTPDILSMFQPDEENTNTAASTSNINLKPINAPPLRHYSKGAVAKLSQLKTPFTIQGSPTNPVYHTINGFKIDLNTAAQQETYRLPNGKLIQVKKQSPGTTPITTTPVTRGNIIQKNNLVNIKYNNAKILNGSLPPPLIIRNTHPNTPIGNARKQFEGRVFAGLDVCQHITGKINTLISSNSFKNVANFKDIQELHIHLSYLFTYAIGRFKSLQEKCTEDMKKYGLTTEKNVSDDDDCEILEPEQTCIELDSDGESTEKVIKNGPKIHIAYKKEKMNETSLSSDQRLTQENDVVNKIGHKTSTAGNSEIDLISKVIIEGIEKSVNTNEINDSDVSDAITENIKILKTLFNEKTECDDNMVTTSSNSNVNILLKNSETDLKESSIEQCKNKMTDDDKLKVKCKSSCVKESQNSEFYKNELNEKNNLSTVEASDKNLKDKSHDDTFNELMEVDTVEEVMEVDTVEELKDPVGELKDTVKQLKVPVGELKDAVEVLKDPVEELKDTVEEFKDPVEELKDTVKQLKDPVEELKDTVKQLKDPVEELKDTVKELKDTTGKQLKDPVEELKDTVEELKDPFEELKDPVEELKDTVEEFKDPVKELKDTVEELKDPVEELKDTVEELNDPVEELKDTVEVLRDPVELKDTVKELKDLESSAKAIIVENLQHNSGSPKDETMEIPSTDDMVERFKILSNLETEEISKCPNDTVVNIGQKEHLDFESKETINQINSNDQVLINEDIVDDKDIEDWEEKIDQDIMDNKKTDYIETKSNNNQELEEIIDSRDFTDNIETRSNDNEKCEEAMDHNNIEDDDGVRNDEELEDQIKKFIIKESPITRKGSEHLSIIMEELSRETESNLDIIKEEISLTNDNKKSEVNENSNNENKLSEKKSEENTITEEVTVIRSKTNALTSIGEYDSNEDEDDEAKNGSEIICNEVLFGQQEICEINNIESNCENQNKENEKQPQCKNDKNVKLCKSEEEIIINSENNDNVVEIEKEVESKIFDGQLSDNKYCISIEPNNAIEINELIAQGLSEF